MIKKTKTHVEKSDLLLYPEVKWDRFGEDFAYGWISRPDGKFDFAILTYVPKNNGSIDVSITSSSAKYNKLFNKRLGATKHQDCKRIEYYFNIKNKIILRKD